MNRAFGPQQTARTVKIHLGARTKARTVSARRINLWGGLTALGDCRESVPGALRQAGMNRAFGPQQTARTGKIHPGAQRKAPKVRTIPAWGEAPGLRAAREARAEGPLHRVLRQSCWAGPDRARSGLTDPPYLVPTPNQGIGISCPCNRSNLVRCLSPAALAAARASSRPAPTCSGRCASEPRVR